MVLPFFMTLTPFQFKYWSQPTLRAFRRACGPCPVQARYRCILDDVNKRSIILNTYHSFRTIHLNQGQQYYNSKNEFFNTRVYYRFFEQIAILAEKIALKCFLFIDLPNYLNSHDLLSAILSIDNKPLVTLQTHQFEKILTGKNLFHREKPVSLQGSLQ